MALPDYLGAGGPSVAVRGGFGVAGRFGGVLRILGSAVGRTLGRLDAGLRPIVYVVKSAIIGSRLFVQLVGMVD